MVRFNIVSLAVLCCAVLQVVSRPDESCANDTGGTCWVFVCDATRGNTTCGREVGYKCVCDAGTCAVDGKCEECTGDTGGTCRLLTCDSSRNARCVRGRCVCAPGYCALFGKCVSVGNGDSSGDASISAGLAEGPAAGVSESLVFVVVLFSALSILALVCAFCVQGQFRRVGSVSVREPLLQR
mmetsp:Transcript_7442/g.20408  ORF Transcript_7442/g.20408 Transcript_7442/m.20408 type:complete len:183 (-) Transcript_7442:88-636(-)